MSSGPARVSAALLFALLAVWASGAVASSGPPPQTVVLLHGLTREAGSMDRMAAALEAAGYRVCNVAYPSREHAVEVLAADYVAPAVRSCSPDRSLPVHFVTHSLGGILVRQLAACDPGIRLGRVVMLSPPNRGSEVVDKLGGLGIFRRVNGPAGLQLGTGADALPRALGPATFEVGVITGNRSINLLLSLLIPGDDDGKVSVENARLAGMKDFLVVPAAHPFIMRNRQAIEQTLHFLDHGTFSHAAPSP